MCLYLHAFLFVVDKCILDCLSVFIPFHKVRVINEYVTVKKTNGKINKIKSKNILNPFSYCLQSSGHNSRHL